jgi:hypothetical protein
MVVFGLSVGFAAIENYSLHAAGDGPEWEFESRGELLKSV